MHSGQVEGRRRRRIGDWKTSLSLWPAENSQPSTALCGAMLRAEAAHHGEVLSAADHADALRLIWDPLIPGRGCLWGHELQWRLSLRESSLLGTGRTD